MNRTNSLVVIKVGDPIKIDEIDNKILRALIKDARARLKDIAKNCGISSVSAFNRIKHLKELGVIKKGTIFVHDESKQSTIIVTIGIELEWNQEQEISKLISEQTQLIELTPSIGKYDLCAVLHTDSVSEIEKITYSIRKQFGARKVTAVIWAKPHSNFENIDLQPMEQDRNG